MIGLSVVRNFLGKKQEVIASQAQLMMLLISGGGGLIDNLSLAWPGELRVRILNELEKERR